jgi:hypothetical protein
MSAGAQTLVAERRTNHGADLLFAEPIQRAIACEAPLPKLIEAGPPRIEKLQEELDLVHRTSAKYCEDINIALRGLTSVEKGAREQLSKTLEEFNKVYSATVKKLEAEIRELWEKEKEIRRVNTIRGELNELAKDYRPLDWNNFLAWPNKQGLPVFAVFNTEGDGTAEISFYPKTGELTAASIASNSGGYFTRAFNRISMARGPSRARFHTSRRIPDQRQARLEDRIRMKNVYEFEKSYLSVLAKNIDFKSVLNNEPDPFIKAIKISAVFEGTIPAPEREIIQRERDSHKWDEILLLAEVENWGITDIPDLDAIREERARLARIRAEEQARIRAEERAKVRAEEARVREEQDRIREEEARVRRLHEMRRDPIIAGLKHGHLFHLGDFDVSITEIDALCVARPQL